MNPKWPNWKYQNQKFIQKLWRLDGYKSFANLIYCINWIGRIRLCMTSNAMWVSQLKFIIDFREPFFLGQAHI